MAKKKQKKKPKLEKVAIVTGILQGSSKGTGGGNIPPTA